MPHTKAEILHPVQQFNMHDDPLTNIETLHLILWDKGLCVAGYDAKGNVLTTKVYSFPKNDIHAIESIFINEPLVAGPQPVTHVWIASDRNLVVPQSLYEETAAATWLKTMHFIEHGEQIKASGVKQNTAATIVFPMDEKLQQHISKYFAEAKIDSLSKVILQHEVTTDQDHAELLLLDKTAVITFRQKGKLLLHQTLSYDHIHDLVYTIGTICGAHQIDMEDFKINLSGLCISEETIQELRSFFAKITVPGSEQFLSFTLLSKLLACA